MFTRRRMFKAFAATMVGVPAMCVVGAGAWIKYRQMTKPPDHQFKALVDSDGGLLLEDCNLTPPTRWETFCRVCRLLSLFVPVFVAYVLVKIRNDWYVWWLELLLDRVQQAGPAFVKAGQWACTRNDLFSPTFREVFGRLYAEVRIHPFAETKRQIEKEFGMPLDELFSRLDETPIGSGSIGQVHHAILKENNQRVAVKVMHPNVVETIAKDFFVIHALAKLADYWFPSLKYFRLQQLAGAWTNHLAAQLDFRIEGEHLQLFNDQGFRDLPYANFPECIRATQHVLIMTYAPGEPATKEFVETLPKHVRDALAAKGLNTYCKMLLRDNFIHGDLHPGNILVDGRDPDDPQVTLIDVGLCQKLSRAEGELAHNLMASFVHWDAKMCEDSLLKMGTTQEFVDEKQFREDTEKIFSRYRPVTGDEEEVVSNILQTMFENVRVSRVTMDPAYVSLLFSVLVLESLIMNLNEEFNMVRHCAPWLLGDGHVSWGLVKKTVMSGLDVAKKRFWTLKSRYWSPEKERYVPTRRPRFEEGTLKA